jgi:membrane protease YdiL (CAAX protease family)
MGRPDADFLTYPPGALIILPMEDKKTKSYPAIKNAVLLCLLFLALQLGLGFVAGLCIGILRLSMDSLPYSIAMIIVQLVSIGAVIVIGHKKTKQKFNEVFRFNPVSGALWVAAVIFMAGYVIVSSELDNILLYFLPMPEIFQEVYQSMLTNRFFIVSLLMVGLLPAFCEEMLFRGLILKGFSENYTEKKAILISAFLFGLIHLNPWQFLSAFLIGLFAGWICLKSKSIVLCVYLHLFNNTLALVVEKAGDALPPGFNGQLSGEVQFQPLWFNLLGLALTAVGFYLLNKNFKAAAGQGPAAPLPETPLPEA